MVDWTRPIETKDKTTAKVLEVLPDGRAVVRYASAYDGRLNAGIYSPDSLYFRNTLAAPKLVPYDFDTFPRGVVWARQLHNEFMVYLRLANGAQVGPDRTIFSWEVLLNNWEISTDDGETWRPCGREG